MSKIGLQKDLCSRLLFHTSRNSILPNKAFGENCKDPEYMFCRPAKLPVSEVPALAGEPRNVRDISQGFKPEVFAKWNEAPKRDIHKEWTKIAAVYSSL